MGPPVCQEVAYHVTGEGRQADPGELSVDIRVPIGCVASLKSVCIGSNVGDQFFQGAHMSAVDFSGHFTYMFNRNENIKVKL